MPQPKEVISNWLDVVETEGRGLTKWEDDFITSIREQFEERGRLSERQEEVLERIYSEKT